MRTKLSCYWTGFEVQAGSLGAFATSPVINKNIQNGPEARQWLSSNGQVAALASNRFESTSNALAFVEQLYGAGAIRVFVPADCIRDDEIERAQGGPYADSLVLEVGSDTDRPRLLALVSAESEREGFGKLSDLPLVDERFVFLWWD